jgi:hypothetical protein
MPDVAKPSEPTPNTPKDVAQIVKELPGGEPGMDSFNVKTSEGYSEKLVDTIEMIGEERAAGFEPPGPSQVTAGMRYLHCSRTIHQLVTDRNRAVGIFLAVSSLLFAACGAILNANPRADLIVSFDHIQRWCLPVTFGALTILSVFMAFLLIRTRVGLIYEVAKMNALLGLPMGRVSHISPLSIFFLMHGLICLAGGGCAAFFAVFMFKLLDPQMAHIPIYATLVGVAVTIALFVLYVVTVTVTTSDARLQKVTGK